MLTWINLQNIMLRGKKPDTKSHVLYDTIYIKFPKKEEKIQR